MASVWVFAELDPSGAASNSALELLTKARDLGDSLAAVVLGSGAKDAAAALGEHGAQTVYASALDYVFAPENALYAKLEAGLPSLTS